MNPRIETTTLVFAAPARRRPLSVGSRSAVPLYVEPLPRAVGGACGRSGDAPESVQCLPVMRPLHGRWASLVATALVALLGSGCASSPDAAPPSASNHALGSTVAFELPSNEGQLLSIPKPKARLTVVDAFAPSCAPCAKKLPALMAKRAELAEAGASIVLVAVLASDESDTQAMDALRSWGVEQSFLVDRGDVLRRELAVAELPATVLVDAMGKVRWVAPLSATAEDIVSAAVALSAE